MWSTDRCPQLESYLLLSRLKCGVSLNVNRTTFENMDILVKYISKLRI